MPGDRAMRSDQSGSGPLRLNPSVVLAPAEDGYLAYDVDTNRLTHLNATAALILELCDGTRDIDAILDAIGPMIGDEGARAVRSWVDRSLKDGWILGKVRRPRPPLSVEQLDRVAGSLHEQGRVLAAFACQSQLAELAPSRPETWYTLAELAHILGRRDLARSSYERYLELAPGDAEVEHMLVSLRDEMPPSRAPDRCIERLYERFAAFYDESMCGDLDYRAPAHLETAITDVIGSRRELGILELGCGTGLAGARLRPLARLLVGIDLSPAMIARARVRGIYDTLEVAEITAWLGRPHGHRFDLIAACDTLIYFGDLGPVVQGATRQLAPGGLIAFTVERGADPPFRLTDNGRFTHHPDHVLDVAQAAGLEVVRLDEVILRHEYDEEVEGMVAVLRANRPA